MVLVVVMVLIAFICFIGLMLYAIFSNQSEDDKRQEDAEQVEYLNKWLKQKRKGHE